MNFQLNIPQPLADNLKNQADSAGVDVATYVLQILDSITQKNPSSNKTTHEQFRIKLQELVDAHPKGLGIVDDTRESIYPNQG